MIDPVLCKTARQALLSKGFVLSDKGNRDHEMYFYMLDGQKTSLFFKLSFGAREVRRDDIQNSARVWRVAGNDLHSILCCRHDAAATRKVCEQAIAAR